MKEKIIFSAFIILFTTLICGTVSAQEKLKTNIILKYYKNSDNTKTLKATVFSKKDKKFVSLNNVTVHFYNKSIETNLGDVQTNNNGDAVLDIPPGKMLIDSLGSFIFIAKFDGDNTYESAEEEITIKGARIELSLSVIDSVKTISVTANEISDGKEIPLEGVDVIFSVKRLFGNLKIGAESIEKGQSSIEFPYNDLPGDSLGTITVCVKVEDNETYGNVEKRENIKWGVPTHHTRENSGIALSLLWGVGSHETTDHVFLGIAIAFVILLIISIIMYQRMGDKKMA